MAPRHERGGPRAAESRPLRASSGGGRADLVYAATALTGVLGLLLNVALKQVERRALAWRQDAEAAR